MNGRNYLRLIWIGAFIALAAVSCWATSESLHLLLSTWPKVLCWIVTICFFIIASLGTKMIVDSLNQDIYMERRGSNLIFGIIILLIFWLLCSMPTNTHTFFYRSVIDDKVSQDISVTQGYLDQIIKNTKNNDQAGIKIQKLRNEVDNLLGQLEAEVKNAANPGFGPQAKKILSQFADILDVPKVNPLNHGGNLSIQGRQKLLDAYRQQIYTLREIKEQNILHAVKYPSDNNIKEAKRNNDNLNLIREYIDNGDTNLNSAEGIKSVCDRLNDGYNTIKINNIYVNFQTEEEEIAFTSPNAVTKVKQMISVFDVWKDYLNGEYVGRGFIFWIIISILVDIAAFVFFDLAFRKHE